MLNVSAIISNGLYWLKLGLTEEDGTSNRKPLCDRNRQNRYIMRLWLSHITSCEVWKKPFFHESTVLWR